MNARNRVGWLLSSYMPSKSKRCHGSPLKVELRNFLTKHELSALLSSYVPSKWKRCHGSPHKVELPNFLFLNEYEESSRMALVELRAVKIGETSWLSTHDGAEKLFKPNVSCWLSSRVACHRSERWQGSPHKVELPNLCFERTRGIEWDGSCRVTCRQIRRDVRDLQTRWS